MRGILEKVPGVDSVDIDYDAKTATITCNDAAVAAAVTKALDASGQYKGTLQN